MTEYDSSAASSTEIVVLNAMSNLLSSTVNTTLLQDGSVRYTLSYRMDLKVLPKLNAVILDPISKWNGHPKVSLEFKKYSMHETNLTVIYDALKLLNASYEYRKISYEQGLAIEIVRITSNSIPMIAYFSNMYKEISREASSMLIESLPPMLYWAMEKDKPMLTQDFSIWMAHWSDPDEALPTKPLPMIMPPASCAANITLYMQEEERFNMRLAKLNYDLHLYYEEKRRFEVKAGYRQSTPEKKELMYKAFVDAEIYKLRQEVLEEMTEVNVLDMLKQARLEEFLHIFDSIEQCQSFLYKEHPLLKNTTETFVNNVKSEFTKINEQKWDLDKATKNTKDFSSIIGTLVFDLSLRAVIGDYAVPVIGGALSVSKLIACITSVTSRNGWLDLADKESRQKIDQNDFIEEFVCKATLCHADKFSSLTDSGQLSLAKFYGKYIYNSLLGDKHQYPDQSSLVDVTLNKLSNKSYSSIIKLNKDLSFLLTKKDNSTISILDYLGDYNQNQCVEDIKSKLAGEEIIFYNESSL